MKSRRTDRVRAISPYALGLALLASTASALAGDVVVTAPAGADGRYGTPPEAGQPGQDAVADASTPDEADNIATANGGHGGNGGYDYEGAQYAPGGKGGNASANASAVAASG